jgi:hypothetical protein
VPLADDLVEQLTLAALPGGDVRADVAVEGAEVLFDEAEVGEQLAGRAAEVLVAVEQGDGIQRWGLAARGPGDLRVDGVAASAAR